MGAENSADNFTGGGTFGTSNINLRGLGIGANFDENRSSRTAVHEFAYFDLEGNSDENAC